MGTVTMTRPRPMSVASITLRRSPRRSIQLPACSEKRRFGTSAAVVKAPICAADACSARTAVSGSAITVIWSPISDTACPKKYRRKFAFSRRSGGITAASLVDRDGGAVEDDAHPARKVVGAERLLQERDPRLEHTVMTDRRVGVAGDVEHERAGPHRRDGRRDVGAAHARHDDVGDEQLDLARVAPQELDGGRAVG